MVANQAFVQGFGGYIFRYDTAQGFDTSDVGLDNEAAIDGANWLDQAVKDGYLSSDVESSNLQDVFVSGESAFLWSGPEDVARIQASGVPYDVTTFPPDGDAVPMPLLGVRGFMISASSELQVAAQLFLTDYVATLDAMMSLFEAERRGPAYVPSFEAALDEDPELAIFADVAADPGLLLPNVANAAGVASALRGAFAVIFNQAYEGDLSGPAEVMVEAATRVRASVGGG